MVIKVRNGNRWVFFDDIEKLEYGYATLKWNRKPTDVFMTAKDEDKQDIRWTHLYLDCMGMYGIRNKIEEPKDCHYIIAICHDRKQLYGNRLQILYEVAHLLGNDGRFIADLSFHKKIRNLAKVYPRK